MNKRSFNRLLNVLEILGLDNINDSHNCVLDDEQKTALNTILLANKVRNEYNRKLSTKIKKWWSKHVQKKT